MNSEFMWQILTSVISAAGVAGVAWWRIGQGEKELSKLERSVEAITKLVAMHGEEIVRFKERASSTASALAELRVQIRESEDRIVRTVDDLRADVRSYRQTEDTNPFARAPKTR